MFESTSDFRVRPVSVIREDSVNGGCQSHSGRLLTAVQMSNWRVANAVRPAAKPIRLFTVPFV